MSLTKVSFFCPPINTCLPKLYPKTNVSFPSKHPHDNYHNHLNNCGKSAVLYKYGYSYFTSSCLKDPIDGDANEHDHGGIGILKFFSGKNIFITGATGLVGKVLVEKMLRSTEVGKIYVLMKAEDKEATSHRLTKEIIGSNLFKSLKEEHGKYFEAFVKEKLVPVVGNICDENLGMDSESANVIKNDVNVIIASAANTTLNARYDLLVDANVIAPQRLMRFAKACKNLELFTHISTAFVNGKREGMMPETPMIMGENGRKYDDDIHSSIPRLDVADEIQLALKLSNGAPTDYEATKRLKMLGQERADFWGWSNPYQMTKAMGEMVLNEIRRDIPLLLIRPSVVESVLRDPLPGWIQGNRMFDPLIISYGKGQLPAILADPEAIMDIIPVDIVANTTIAAMARHGTTNTPQLNVYHVSSSMLNPLKYSDFFEHLYQYFVSKPLVGGETIHKIAFFDNIEDFSKYTKEEIQRRNARKSKIVDERAIDQMLQRRYKAKVAYAEQVCKMYKFVGFLNARFHTGNTQNLSLEMSEQEQLAFEVDTTKIDWRNYLQDIHIPGLREHVIHDPQVWI